MNSVILFCCLLPAVALGLSIKAGPGQKVVGGANSNIANHPWQASLRINNGHACGAVLISATRALTAAHCGGTATSAYSILAGTTDRTVQTCATCALRSVQAVARHPAYVNNPSAGYPNDIATVWFYSIAENVNIHYIEMAQLSDGLYVGANCVVSGWGREVPGGDLPSTLQSASMRVITNNDCVAVWGTNRIRSEHICAQAPGVSVCGGDQGGPLICEDKLAGVYSWGEANCGPQFPSVFIRVSEYYDWIIESDPAHQSTELDDSAATDDIESLMASLFSESL